MGEDPFLHRRAGIENALLHKVNAEKFPLTTDGREYREGYETIDYRDLEARQLYRASVTDVRGIDVETVPGLNIGYVMGIGDQVPDGIRQLGYTVTLLDEGELARGNLSRFDAIVTGTRAYAVREDLKTYSRRLLDYVELDDDFAMIKTKPPRQLVGVTLREAQAHTRLRVTVVAVKRETDGPAAQFAPATGETVLMYGDTILALGSIGDLERFSELE